MEKLSDMVKKLWQAVKTVAQEYLTNVLKTPDDADLQAVFRVQLRKFVEEDAAFGEKLQTLLKDAQATMTN